MNRLATKITVRHHTYISDRDKGRVESYYSHYYEVGKKCVNPAGDSDVVEQIVISSSWNPHVELTFELFGEYWLNDYVVDVEFRAGDYDVLIAERKQQQQTDNE